MAGAVRIPGEWRWPWSRPERIEEQYDLSLVGKWIEKIVRGEVSPSAGAVGLRTIPLRPFITRDCNYRLRGLRADNRYKYIVDTATDERFLFDLKSDPGETRNIAEASPQIMQELEAKFWELYPVYSIFAVNNCKLWPGY